RGERAPDAPAVALRLDRPPTVRLPCRSLSHRPSVPGSAREAAEPEQPPHGRVLPRIFPTLDVSRVTGCDGAGRTTSPRFSCARAYPRHCPRPPGVHRLRLWPPLRRGAWARPDSRGPGAERAGRKACEYQKETTCIDFGL